MNESCTFTSFDIVKFYPSISEGLLQRAIRFAKDHIESSDEEVCIMQHSRRFVLFSKDRAWVTKEGAGLFDMAMGSYDGAKICELVGIFALSQLPERYDKSNIALYRDNGLAVFKEVLGSAAERVKKDIIRSFN